MTSALLTTRDLDRAVASVVALRSDVAAGFWRLGSAIRDIHDRRLWALRTEADGTASYRSFAAFADRELHISPSHAHALIEIATEYTEAQARALGSTRCALILRAAPEDRAALVAVAEEGASTREIGTAAKESRKRRDYKRPGQHARAGSKGRERQQQKKTPAPKARPTSERSDVANVERHTVRLHAGAQRSDGCTFADLPLATSLDDLPVGTTDLADGRRIRFSVIRSRKGDHLVAVIEIRGAA